MAAPPRNPRPERPVRPKPCWRSTCRRAPSSCSPPATWTDTAGCSLRAASNRGPPPPLLGARRPRSSGPRREREGPRARVDRLCSRRRRGRCGGARAASQASRSCSTTRASPATSCGASTPRSALFEAAKRLDPQTSEQVDAQPRGAREAACVARTQAAAEPAQPPYEPESAELAPRTVATVLRSGAARIRVAAAAQPAKACG